MKRKKLPKLSTLRNKLDKVFSLYIRQRDGNICFTCGRRGKGMQAGHFIPKKMNGLLLRYHPRNVHCQCFVCNRYCEGNGAIYSLKLRMKYGEEYDKELLALIPESKLTKPTREWYQRCIDIFQDELVILEEMKYHEKEEQSRA